MAFWDLRSVLCTLQALEAMPRCRCLGISYFGNDALNGRELSFICSRVLHFGGLHPIGCTKIACAGICAKVF